MLSINDPWFTCSLSNCALNNKPLCKTFEYTIIKILEIIAYDVVGYYSLSNQVST